MKYQFPKIKQYEQYGYPPPVKITLPDDYDTIASAFHCIADLLDNAGYNSKNTVPPPKIELFVPYHQFQDLLATLWQIISAAEQNMAVQAEQITLISAFRLLHSLTEAERAYLQNRLQLIKQLDQDNPPKQ